MVLDTNTALSGLLWGGTPGRLIDAAEQQRIELASSTALLADGYAALVTILTPHRGQRVKVTP